MTKNWNDPEKGEAAKEAYQAYREGTEEAAWNDLNEFGENATVDGVPVKQALTESKNVYGKLAPLEKLASKGAERAETANRFGNFNDLLVGGATGAAAGPLGAVGAVVAKHVIVPRMASTSAVTADFISNLIKTTPGKLGQFSQPLSNAIARGSNAFGATHYILQSTSPEYRPKKKEIEEEKQNE